jgi:hypothetical protein
VGDDLNCGATRDLSFSTPKKKEIPKGISFNNLKKIFQIPVICTPGT